MASGKSRRDALLIGLGLVAVAAGWQVWVRRPRAVVFRDIDGLPGWRQVEGGEVSTGVAGAVFAGLGSGDAVTPLEPHRLCEVLFDAPQTGVPVAIFTDVNCPFCRQVAPSLAARAADGVISLNWLEWPIYGARSEEVARALVAARTAGGAEKLRALLYGGPSMPLSRAVDGAGLSPGMLAERMSSAAVDRRLGAIDRAAALLRLPGTPSMIIGRTLVIGAVTPAELDRLIEIEQEEQTRPCR